MARKIQVEIWQANNGNECRLELEALIEDFNAAAVDPEELTVRGTLKPTHEFTEAIDALYEYVHRGQANNTIRIPLPVIVYAIEDSFRREMRAQLLWYYEAPYIAKELDRELNRGPISAIAYARKHGSATAAVLAVSQIGGW